MGENRIEYVDKCPMCLKDGATDENGQPRNLGLDMDTGKICCLAGHEFDELPSETVPEKPMETAVAIPGVCTQPETPKSESDFGVSQIADEPSAQEDAAKLGKIALVMGDESIAPQVAEIAKDSNPERALEPLPRKVVGVDRGSVKVGESQAITLENGDLLLGVRISEQWRQAVEAEAEAKGMKTADYFAEWLTSEEMRDAFSDLLANYWLANYQQKAV